MGWVEDGAGDSALVRCVGQRAQITAQAYTARASAEQTERFCEERRQAIIRLPVA